MRWPKPKRNHCSKSEEILNGKLHILCSELKQEFLIQYQNQAKQKSPRKIYEIPKNLKKCEEQEKLSKNYMVKTIINDLDPEININLSNREETIKIK